METNSQHGTDAHRERLNHGLRTLASWCASRAMLEHDTETTLTMLEKKAAELRGKCMKAGWAAIAEHSQTPDRATSIEAMAIKGMESRLRKLADQMDETAEALELCENNVGIEGAAAKAEEMRGAATVTRDWADHIILQNAQGEARR